MASKKHTKIKQFRKPINLNIGMLIFGTIFIYIIVCIVMYFQTSHIVRYEVRHGSLASNNIYRAVAIREETVVHMDTAGYVNYYAREGERVAKNDLVYTADETGHLTEYLDDLNLGENSLDEKELAEFRDEISSFMHGFQETDFSNVYDFKYSIKNTVLKIANVNMLQGIQNINGVNGTTAVNFCNAPMTGIVSYWTDGLEGLTTEQIDMTVFDEEKHPKNQYINNQLLAEGDAVYKIMNQENWSVVIPIEDEERAKELEEEKYVKVRFFKNQYESWGATQILRGTDDKTYIKLTFSNSMVTFANERYIDIELILHDEKGLKIPNSSIVEKDFFVVPKEYITKSGEKDKDGVICQTYLEDGTISSEVRPVSVYSYDSDSNEYFLGTDDLKSGDVLYKPDSQETFTVSKRATLIGVYNMNKGYADFKQIHVLYQNDEYSIVKANTVYGLNEYDYIVLNADAVSDDQFINN